MADESRKKQALEKSDEPVVNVDKSSETAETSKAAKAGKRSAKSQKESAAKQAKTERKLAQKESESTEKPRTAVKPTRTRLERSGKKLRAMAEKVEKGKYYTANDALELVTKTSAASFDATVELHVNLNVDPHQADQNVRDSLVLPAGTGKQIKIAVLSDDEVTGADISGVQTILGNLEKGLIDFDILIATPPNMPKLGKYARLLGPRGLMPNPKSGTVTNDLTKAVGEAKAGRIEYRVDSTGIVHLGIGKVSFGKDRLLQNFNAVAASIKSNKPSSVKAGYIKSVHVSSTMGPGISIATNEL